MAGADIALASFTDLTGYVAQNIRRLAGLGYVVSAEQKGAKADNVTDDAAAINAAIVACAALGGGSVVLPEGRTCLIGSRLDLAAGVVLVGNDTVIRHTGQGFRANGVTGAGLVGITFDGSGAASGQNLIQGCSSFTMTGCTFLGQVASVALTGATAGAFIANNRFTNGRSTALELNGANVSQNVIFGNVFTSNAGFSCWMTGGTNRNTFQGNSTTASGLELLGITYTAWGNRVIGNHAEATGDNGISISGFNNTVIGNVIRRCAFHGLALYGSRNTAAGNTIIANGQAGGAYGGIAFPPNVGGLAQLNAVTGNFIDDDQAVPTQAYGIKVNGNGYTAWAQGQVISATGTFRYNGLNLYVSASTGTTGASGPTHTSGTVSDGNVQWTYVDTAILAMEPAGNVLSGNVIQRFLTADILDGGTLHANQFDGFYRGTGSPLNVVPAGIGSRYVNLSGGAGTTLYVKESGTGTTGWVAK